MKLLYLVILMDSGSKQDSKFKDPNLKHSKGFSLIFHYSLTCHQNHVIGIFSYFSVASLQVWVTVSDKFKYLSKQPFAYLNLKRIIFST